MDGWLRSEGLSNITLTKDQSVLNSDLGQYDLLVLSLQLTDFSSAAEEALVAFVEGGKRLMAIHPASVIDEKYQKYIGLLGCRFSHHSPYQEFTVKVAAPGHPVVDGLGDFKITDELYVMDKNPSSADVLLTAFWEDHAQPMLYVRTAGMGRVMYNAMGHDQAAYENPNYRKTIEQGVKWLLKWH